MGGAFSFFFSSLWEGKAANRDSEKRKEERRGGIGNRRGHAFSSRMAGSFRGGPDSHERVEQGGGGGGEQRQSGIKAKEYEGCDAGAVAEHLCIGLVVSVGRMALGRGRWWY